MEDYRLEAKDFAKSATGMSWRWVLTRPGGTFLDDHDVSLDYADPQYRAFADPFSWLEDRPDDAGDRIASEQRAVAGLGDWISERVFGGIAGVLAGKAPCTVLVVLEGEAFDLAFLPFELARVDGRPLAARNVSLVINLNGDQARPGQLSAGELRVLGLFSLPDSAEALSLRRERHELERLIGELAGTGRAVSFRALQYGVTRELLTKAVKDGKGWDVVHLSGHGKAGRFSLEGPDGSRDPVTSDDLVELLSPLRPRVKLITVSACDSAERVARQQYEMLAGRPDTGAGGDPGDPGESAKALATDLARRLGCAVIGMRYPVTESFASAFVGELYRLLFDNGMPLPKARAMATATAAGPATVDRPALSAGVPALYSASALDLKLTAPPTGSPVIFSYEGTKLAGIPAKPARFVGQVVTMSRAGRALAPRSGRSAIVLHGMDQIGKTSLAIELAHTQRDNFQSLIWHRVPQRATDNIAAAVAELAATLDRNLAGLPLGGLLGDEAGLRDFLPKLTEFFRVKRILLVIDNVDVLLTAARSWRDDRMKLVFDALTGHAGLGRVIVTTRQSIAGIDDRFVLAEPVKPLWPGEAVLLGRELPQLCTLLDGAAPPLNKANALGLAARVLNATRGHPRLLEMAEERAADLIDLAKAVLVAERVWLEHGGAGASPPYDPAGYRAVLDAWTRPSPDRTGPAA